MTSLKGKASTYTQTETLMKETEKIIKPMAKENSHKRAFQHMKDTGLTTSNMEKVLKSTKTDQYSTESLKTAKRMGKAN